MWAFKEVSSANLGLSAGTRALLRQSEKAKAWIPPETPDGIHSIYKIMNVFSTNSTLCGALLQKQWESNTQS